MDPERKLPVESNKDAILRFTLNFTGGRTKVECSKNIQSINILTKWEKLQEILDQVRRDAFYFPLWMTLELEIHFHLLLLSPLQRATCGSGMCDSKMFKPVVQQQKAAAGAAAAPRSKREAAAAATAATKEAQMEALDGELDNSSNEGGGDDAAVIPTPEKKSEEEDDRNGCKDVNIRLDSTTDVNGNIFFNTR